MRVYLLANRTERCVEYLQYRAESLCEALTMAERDGATCEVLPEDVAEMQTWPEDWVPQPVHRGDWRAEVVNAGEVIPARYTE